jgi:hypothetical protein
LSRGKWRKYGIGKEHGIPLVRIRYMTDRCYERVKEIWRGLGGKPPPKKFLKKLAP